MPFRRILLVFLGCGALCAATPDPAEAQASRRTRPPEPEVVELQTTDGVLLGGAYFPALETGKSTPVVVMLADQDESPAVFDRLAARLQAAEGGKDDPTGISVLAVALRGQGDSTRVRGPDGVVTDRRGARLTPLDAAAMVKTDLEAVRRFLVDKNDLGELNLNRLAYLGVGLGAIVATNGAAVDWSAPVLNRSKQGRDVKALVLVSPPWKQLGLEMLGPLRQPGVQKEVAVLVTYGGEDKRATGDAERVVRQLEKGRPEPGENEPPTVVDAPGASRLQGSAWLKQTGPDGETAIVEFLQHALAKPEFEWSQRRLD